MAVINKDVVAGKRWRLDPRSGVIVANLFRITIPATADQDTPADNDYTPITPRLCASAIHIVSLSHQWTALGASAQLALIRWEKDDTAEEVATLDTSSTGAESGGELVHSAQISSVDLNLQIVSDAQNLALAIKHATTTKYTANVVCRLGVVFATHAV